MESLRGGSVSRRVQVSCDGWVVRSAQIGRSPPPAAWGVPNCQPGLASTLSCALVPPGAVPWGVEAGASSSRACSRLRLSGPPNHDQNLPTLPCSWPVIAELSLPGAVSDPKMAVTCLATHLLFCSQWDLLRGAKTNSAEMMERDNLV